MGPLQLKAEHVGSDGAQSGFQGPREEHRTSHRCPLSSFTTGLGGEFSAPGARHFPGKWPTVPTYPSSVLGLGQGWRTGTSTGHISRPRQELAQEGCFLYPIPPLPRATCCHKDLSPLRGQGRTGVLGEVTLKGLGRRCPHPNSSICNFVFGSHLAPVGLLWTSQSRRCCFSRSVGCCGNHHVVLPARGYAFEAGAAHGSQKELMASAQGRAAPGKWPAGRAGCGGLMGRTEEFLGASGVLPLLSWALGCERGGSAERRVFCGEWGCFFLWGLL